MSTATMSIPNLPRNTRTPAPLKGQGRLVAGYLKITHAILSLPSVDGWQDAADLMNKQRSEITDEMTPEIRILALWASESTQKVAGF